MANDFDMKPLDELDIDVDAVQRDIARIERNKRRNRRQQVAKHMERRGQSAWASTQTPPRARKLRRLIAKHYPQAQQALDNLEQLRADLQALSPEDAK